MEEDADKYVTVVLSSGGVKAIMEIGAVWYLQESGKVRIRKIVGSSAGALIGALICIGITPMEIMSLIVYNNLFSFLSLEEMKKKRALFDERNLQKVLKTQLRNKLGMVPTLRGLYNATNIKLRINTCVTNPASPVPIYLDADSHPNLGIIEALTMSYSVPVLLHGTQYEGRSYADGGIVDPVPYRGVSPDDGKTLVIVVSTLRSIITKTEEVEPSVLATLYRTIGVMHESLVEQSIVNIPANMDIIHLRCEDLNILGLNVSMEKKIALYIDGYKQAELQMAYRNPN